MIVVDWNNVVMANLMQEVNATKSDVFEDKYLHTLVEYIIRSIEKKFTERYGTMPVLCADSTIRYWRKSIFPHYKAKRKKSRESSIYDWDNIHDAMNRMRNFVTERSDTCFVEVEGAEADDVIGTLCEAFAPQESILIVSSDKDLIQLQRYHGVRQYSPLSREWLDCDYPDVFLKDRLLKGDDSDSIPNYRSPDDVFIRESIRQSPVTKKLYEKFMALEDPTTEMTDEEKRNYERNRSLIDLKLIPDEIKTAILDEFEYQKPYGAFTNVILH